MNVPLNGGLRVRLLRRSEERSEEKRRKTSPLPVELSRLRLNCLHNDENAKTTTPEVQKCLFSEFSNFTHLGHPAVEPNLSEPVY